MGSRLNTSLSILATHYTLWAKCSERSTSNRFSIPCSASFASANEKCLRAIRQAAALFAPSGNRTSFCHRDVAPRVACRSCAKNVEDFPAATEAKNGFRIDLSESNRSGCGLRQERGRPSCVGSTRLRFHRDRNGNGQGAAGKSATTHLSLSRTTSAD